MKDFLFRNVVPGGTGGAMADQLTLYQPGGADYAHHINTGTPGFSDLPTALLFVSYLHIVSSFSCDSYCRKRRIEIALLVFQNALPKIDPHSI